MLDSLWRNLKKIYIVVLTKPLTVSKPREAFLGNASQLEMIFLHSCFFCHLISNVLSL